MTLFFGFIFVLFLCNLHLTISKLLIPSSMSQPSTSLLPKNKNKILLIVEPTPFTYISGYTNRFKEMLNYFSTIPEDEVEIITPDQTKSAPTNYKGA